MSRFAFDMGGLSIYLSFQEYRLRSMIEEAARLGFSKILIKGMRA